MTCSGRIRRACGCSPALYGRVPGLRLLLAYRSDEVPPEGSVAEFLRRTCGGRRSTSDRCRHRPRSADVGARARGSARAAHRRTPLAVTEVVRELAVTGAITRDGQGRWQVRPVGRARRGQPWEHEVSAGRSPPEPGGSRAFPDRSSRCWPFSGARHPHDCSPLLRRFRARGARALGAWLTPTSFGNVSWAGDSFTTPSARCWRAELSDADRARWQAQLAAALDSADGEQAERARLWREAGDRDAGGGCVRGSRPPSPRGSAPTTRPNSWRRTAWRWPLDRLSWRLNGARCTRPAACLGNRRATSPEPAPISPTRSRCPVRAAPGDPAGRAGRVDLRFRGPRPGVRARRARRRRGRSG